MRLPRRVPWQTADELDALCSAVFRPPTDVAHALRTLAAWAAMTRLPHALDATHALLAAIALDDPAATTPPTLVRRHAYAAALIRLVNGLVDPLQLGAYARSIAAIAAQLRLPPAFVELRHAATHEDLPSIQLLRGAAHQAMTWLLHNYFLPTINPATVPVPELPALRPISPVFSQYRVLLKTVTRDASLRSRRKPEIADALKAVERWLAEAAVAAGAVLGALSSDPRPRPDRDPRERWALEQLADALLEKGALVPLSKKKRACPDDVFHPPPFSVRIWSPLLHHLRHLHVAFPAVLCTHFVQVLLSPKPVHSRDPSYHMCVARWVMWAVDAWGDDEGDDEHDDDDEQWNLRKTMTVTLIQTLGRDPLTPLPARNAANALLEALCAASPEMRSAVDALAHAPMETSVTVWTSDDLAEMDRRLNVLLSPTTQDVPMVDLDLESHTASDVPQVPGWRMLDTKSQWKPCPIGVYVAG